MEHLYLVHNHDQLCQYEAFVRENGRRIDAFSSCLMEHFAVRELPRAVVWTDAETATTLLSDIPVPAYTDEFRTVITADFDAWKKLLLQQLDPYHDADQDEVASIQACYDGFAEQHVLQILGHELVHHSEWFDDDFDDERESGIWFEEGMAEYISRRFFLSDQSYAALADANQKLVALYEREYGLPDLEAFGAGTYRDHTAGIFCAYWRSFLAVEALVKRFDGVHAVFESYRQWKRCGCEKTLTDWFHVK